MNLNTIRQRVLARAAQSASFGRNCWKTPPPPSIQHETGWSIPRGFSRRGRITQKGQVTVSGAASLSDEELAGVAAL